jgi:hypothetical protein
VSTNFLTREEEMWDFGNLRFTDKSGDVLNVKNGPGELEFYVDDDSGQTSALQKEDVKQLIEYLQNWVDTGNFDAKD